MVVWMVVLLQDRITITTVNQDCCITNVLTIDHREHEEFLLSLDVLGHPSIPSLLQAHSTMFFLQGACGAGAGIQVKAGQ